MNKEYNGWTNYATWRVNVEIIDGIEIDTIICAEYIKELVEDVVFSQYELFNGSHLIEDYARAFVSQVNFYEIAQRINEELELQT
jgi:hypothetical protein